MNAHCTLSETQLRAWTDELFRRAGVGPLRARQATDVLLWASLRGVDSHGVRNLRQYYLEPLSRGEIEPNAPLKVLHETPLVIRFDGGDAMGLNTAHEAMQVAVQKATAAGVGIATVRNSHHLGPAGYYAHLALPHRMVGLALTGHFFAQGREYGVAPFNTLLRMLSTNPLSCAIPAGNRDPFLLDMSTSIVTVNRVQRLGQLGQTIPLGWALDALGELTNDPLRAKIFRPLGGTPDMGGHKGLALSMLIGLVCGVLTGGWNCESDPQHVDGVAPAYDQRTMGHLVAAIQVEHFMPWPQFQQALDAYLAAIEQAPRQDPHQPIVYPGLQEAQTARWRGQHGIPLTRFEWDDLSELSERYGVPLPAAHDPEMLDPDTLETDRANPGSPVQGSADKGSGN